MSAYSPTPYLCRASHLSTELVVVPASELERARKMRRIDGTTQPVPRRHPVYGPAVRIQVDIRSAQECLRGEQRPAAMREMSRAAAELAMCWRNGVESWPTIGYAVTAREVLS